MFVGKFFPKGRKSLERGKNTLQIFPAKKLSDENLFIALPGLPLVMKLDGKEDMKENRGTRETDIIKKKKSIAKIRDVARCERKIHCCLLNDNIKNHESRS